MLRSLLLSQSNKEGRLFTKKRRGRVLHSYFFSLMKTKTCLFQGNLTPHTMWREMKNDHETKCLHHDNRGVYCRTTHTKRGSYQLLREALLFKGRIALLSVSLSLSLYIYLHISLSDIWNVQCSERVLLKVVPFGLEAVVFLSFLPSCFPLFSVFVFPLFLFIRRW